jgi:hypothetical protein
MPVYDVTIIGTPPHPDENRDGELIMCEIDGPDELIVSHQIRTVLRPHYPNWNFTLYMKEKPA